MNRGRRKRWFSRGLAPAPVIAVSVLAAFCVGGAIFARWGAFGERIVGPTARVRRGPMMLTITAPGEFKGALQRVPAGIAVEYEITEYGSSGYGLSVSWLPRLGWTLPDGTPVNEGDVVAELERSELEDRIVGLDSDLISQQAAYETAKHQLEINKIDSEATLASAEMALGLAVIDMTSHVGFTPSDDEIARAALIFEEKLAERLPGMDVPVSREAEVGQQSQFDAVTWIRPGGKAYLELLGKRLQVEKAEAAVRMARDRASETEGRFQEGFETRHELETAKFAVTVDEANLKTCELALDRFIRQELPYELGKLALNVQEKRAALAEARRTAEKQAAKAQLGARRVAEKIQDTQRQIAALRGNLERTTIRAPVAGICMQGDPATGQSVTPGEYIWPGRAVVTIMSSEGLGLEVLVKEIDVDDVQVGQEAFIKWGKARRVLKGRVSKISSKIIRVGGQKYYPVAIEAHSPTPELKPGMTANASIAAGDVADALYVPAGAIFREGDREICYVIAYGRTRPREVFTGCASTDFVEITGGLQEGERVALYRPGRWAREET